MERDKKFFWGKANFIDFKGQNEAKDQAWWKYGRGGNLRGESHGQSLNG